MRIVFGKIRKKNPVISSAVFSHLRHPIYLGAILMYLALVVFSTLFIGGNI